MKYIPTEVQATSKMQEIMKGFDTSIYEKMCNSLTAKDVKPEDLKWTSYEDNDETPHFFPEDQDILFEFFNTSLIDGLINSELLLH